MEEYDRVIDFINSYPKMHVWIPDDTFSVLFLQCTVECVCAKSSCLKSHKRRWKSNVNSLAAKGKLHLVTEFRIVMTDESKQPLDLSKAVLVIVPGISSVVSNVSSIVMVGNGAFEAGSLQTLRQMRSEAEEAADTIHRTFQNVSSLRLYSPNHTGDDSPCATDIPDYVWSQLEHADVLTPLSNELVGFCQNLTTLRLNSACLQMNADLPGIPTHCLRELDLYRIVHMFPWRLFNMSKGVVDFSNLESLTVEFVWSPDQPASFPGEGNDIVFGSLETLKVCGSGLVYLDFYTFFIGNPITKLSISEDPAYYSSIDFSILKDIKQLRVGHPTGYPQFMGRYSVAAIESLFESQSTVEEAVIDGLLYPIPVLTPWANLCSLHFLVSIADTNCMTSLLFQLPSLQKLTVVSYSMDRNDAEDMLFADQAVNFQNVDDMLDPDDRFPINESLLQLNLYAYTGFDWFGLYTLRKWVCSSAALTKKLELLSEPPEMLSISLQANDPASSVATSCAAA
ncbi:hypothetical protein DL89DRAFT_282503 [Linderina pennispora]|uniref:F-box domain-containing protein n=1 Tax=Linderina pennispora TaxID=61395 RepID=A0A1Y1WH48_9FUNG|nr:uncharacterized protein DL89DRAFT_282503 [Linderina pennispora]ORX72444.1 hypothetical protein DL89DRAFT_282503 [Linderina pennispora]